MGIHVSFITEMCLCYVKQHIRNISLCKYVWYFNDNHRFWIKTNNVFFFSFSSRSSEINTIMLTFVKNLSPLLVSNKRVKVHYLTVGIKVERDD